MREEYEREKFNDFMQEREIIGHVRDTPEREEQFVNAFLEMLIFDTNNKLQD